MSHGPNEDQNLVSDRPMPPSEPAVSHETKAETLNDMIQVKTGRNFLAEIPTTCGPVIIPRRTFNSLKTARFDTSYRSKLVNLAPETLIRIIDFLPEEGICYLAQTCKFVMQLSMIHELVEFQIINKEGERLIKEQLANGLFGNSRASKTSTAHLPPDRLAHLDQTNRGNSAPSKPSLTFSFIGIRRTIPWITGHENHYAIEIQAQLHCSLCKASIGGDYMVEFTSFLLWDLRLHLIQHGIACNEKILRLACYQAIGRFLKSTEWKHMPQNMMDLSESKLYTRVIADHLRVLGAGAEGDREVFTSVRKPTRRVAERLALAKERNRSTAFLSHLL